MADGVVTAADIDLAARRMLGPRMCVTGLCEQKDIAGLVFLMMSENIRQC